MTPIMSAAFLGLYQLALSLMGEVVSAARKEISRIHEIDQVLPALRMVQRQIFLLHLPPLSLDRTGKLTKFLLTTDLPVEKYGQERKA